MNLSMFRGDRRYFYFIHIEKCMPLLPLHTENRPQLQTHFGA